MSINISIEYRIKDVNKYDKLREKKQIRKKKITTFLYFYSIKI